LMASPLTALLWLLPTVASAAEAPKPPPAEKADTAAQQSPQEQNLLQEIFRVTESYEQESKAFKREIQALIEQRYKEKRNLLGESYEKAIRDLEVQERKERLDAVAQFEEFLRRYPDDPRYTPDVMFRLAELYYERSSDDQVLAMHQYEEKLKQSPNEQPPPEPTVDFSKSIAIYRELLSRFPNYRLNDASYYLLGYCLEKQNQLEQGQEAYHQLIARYPKSKFTTEAWVRI